MYKKKKIKHLNYLEDLVKKRYKKGIKGFTMRSSCAPYKGCNKRWF